MVWSSPDAEELEHSLSSLLQLSESLNSIFDLDRLLEVLIEQAVALTDAESGCTGLRTAGEMPCGHFFQSSGIVPVTYDRRPETGWPARILENKTYYVTNEALEDTVIEPAIREQFGIRSGMCIPLLDRQILHGSAVEKSSVLWDIWLVPILRPFRRE